MNRNEMVDLYRLVGEELYRKFKQNTISIFPAYDTSDVKADTNITELVHETFVQPYLEKLENDENVHEELQYILASIKNTLVEYDKLKKRDTELEKDAYSLSVSKALNGDKGAH